MQKKFKVGDKVTYKSINNIVGGKYFHGGICHSEFIGEIIKYGDFNKDRNCYEILVTNDTGGYEYWMLEDEFIEFNNENEMFPIF